MVNINIEVDDVLYQKVKMLALKFDVTRKSIVLLAIKDYVSKSHGARS